MKTKLDWESSKSYSFLNPRMPPSESRFLTTALGRRDISLKGHLFILSSGTTAQSSADWKWVALSKSAFLNSAKNVNHHLESTSGDVWLHPLPDFHVGGLAIWARAYLSGAQIVRLKQWDCNAFVERLREDAITLTSLVPAQVHDLVKAKRVCPGVKGKGRIRAILVGGGAMPRSLYDEALKLNWPVLPTYGMTETCSQVATAPLDLSSPNLQILPHWEVESVGPKNSEGGQLAFRSDGSLLTGYLIPDRTSNQAIFEDPKRDGWFISKDCGWVKNQVLHFRGRVDDFIKIGGEGVDLNRLRSLLEEIKITTCEGEEDVALLAVPDARLGHVIHLVVNRETPAAKVCAWMDAFNSRVLAFERIRKYHLLDQIPRTSLGKLISAECLRRISH